MRRLYHLQIGSQERNQKTPLPASGEGRWEVKNQCASCGKFKPWKVLHSMANEDEEWFECWDCMSISDKEDVQRQQQKERQVFLGEMMLWCFKFGCEVQLRNKAQNFAPMNPLVDRYAVGEFHERERDGSIVDMAHRTNYKVIECPELIFKRGERQVSIVGHSWDDLLKHFEHSHKRIFMELSVPMFGGSQ